MDDRGTPPRLGVDRAMAGHALLTVLAVSIGILTALYLPGWAVPVAITLAIVVVSVIALTRSRRRSSGSA